MWGNGEITNGKNRGNVHWWRQNMGTKYFFKKNWTEQYWVRTARGSVSNIWDLHYLQVIATFVRHQENDVSHRFFSLSPSFQEMRYPNLAIFERRICSESAPPIWSSSRCWSKEASPAVENRVPLVTWRFGNRRQPKHRDQKEIISNGSDLISIYRIYRYLPVIFDVSHAFQA